MDRIDEKKQQASTWFKTLRDDICLEFEKIETSDSKFERTPWDRENSTEPNASGSILQGGGEISLMKGNEYAHDRDLKMLVWWRRRPHTDI